MRKTCSDIRTFSTYAEAQDYLLTLSGSGYRIIGAPGTDTWIAEKGNELALVKVTKKSES